MKKIKTGLMISLLFLSGFIGVISISSHPVRAYTSHEPIVINSNDDFINQGWPGSGTETDPWIIEGLEIDGLNEWKCIEINNVEGHFEIRDCYLYHSKSVYTTIGISLEYVTNCLIFDNEIANNDGEGILLKYSNNNSIYNNNIHNNSAGIRFSSSDYNYAQNNTLIENSCGISLVSSDYNKISNNNNQIIEGDIYSKRGIEISNSDYNYILNNTASGHYRGIALEGSIYNQIYSNYVSENWAGIDIEDSYWNNVSFNHAERNNAAGIRLEDSLWNNISKNKMTYGYSSGLALIRSGANIIYDNEISNNPYNGIVIYYMYGGNTIESNRIYSNGHGGINLTESNNNQITNNTIEKNDVGIVLYHSFGNSIYQNDFIENTEQVEIESQVENCSAMWDSGNTHRGNYWSDYNGTDNDGDNIGDSAYVIDSYNQDNYPLITPHNAQDNPDFPIVFVFILIGSILILTLLLSRKRKSISHMNDKAAPSRRVGEAEGPAQERKGGKQ